MDIQLDPLPIVEKETPSIIKVIGVGGGGGNAVNHMYRQGITDVTFVVCNTDKQDLLKSPVPNKIQLGDKTTKGLGAGAFPEKGREAAEESIEDIRAMLQDNTEMVFITAGMGGGTGTGAAPVVAREARELGILTIGIVTIPFAFEGDPKIQKAFEGIAALNEHVDAILVINNEKLRKIYPDLNISNAFRCADDVLANAAKSIAEIITVSGHINIDFADVRRVLKDGNVAIMNTGTAMGENRVENAIKDALVSPLIDSDITSAKKILLNLYCSGTDEDQIGMEEVEQINKFMQQMGRNIEVIWGITFDDSLEQAVKVTLIATGFNVSNIPGMSIKIHKQQNPNAEPKTEQPPSVVNTSPVENTDTVSPQDIKTEIEKAISESYEPKTPPVEIPIEEEKEEDIPVIDIDDLDKLYDFEDEDIISEKEQIPAWKRKLNN